MSEIYIEGRFKMPVINTDEFGYDEEEVKKLNWEDFAKDEFWNSCDDMGKLEDKYDITFHKVQPQLTIPESVADSIKIGKSKLTPALAIRWKGSLYNLTTGNIKLSKESLNWVLNGKSEKEVEDRNLVLFAYLNPLTRDLVKVVDE